MHPGSCQQHAGAGNLPAATLYVTLEPCPMCAGAALQARIGTAGLWSSQTRCWVGAVSLAKYTA